MCKDRSTSGNFSEYFQKIFGEHNLQDPNTPSADIIEYIQGALIEQRLTIDDEESRLQLLDSNFPRAISKNTHNPQNYYENPFSNTDSKQKTQKYIALYANFKQLRMHESRDELAKICQYTEESIAVRLRGKKKVQNLCNVWYKKLPQHLATQGDFGREPP